MAGSVNKVILVGNLGADPEIKRTQDGRPIANLSVATSETWRDKQSGERKEKTEWHNVVIFNDNLAKVAEQYLKKGMKVYVEGQLQTRKWQDQSGQDRYSTEVVLLYLESFGNPRKFSRIARRVSRSKPIVAVKSQATGEERISQMVLEQAGVVRVATISELFDAASLFAYQPLPAGPRTVIVGNSSALGALASAVGADLGLQIVDSVDVADQAAIDSALDSLFEPTYAENADPSAL